MKSFYIYHDVEQLGLRVFTSEIITNRLKDINSIVTLFRLYEHRNLTQQTDEYLCYVMHNTAAFVRRTGCQPYRVLSSLSAIGDPTRELYFREGRLYSVRGLDLIPYKFESCSNVKIVLDVVRLLHAIRVYLRKLFVSCESLAILYSTTHPSLDARTVSLTVFQSVLQPHLHILQCVDDNVIAPSISPTFVYNTETILDISDETLIKLQSYDENTLFQVCHDIIKHDTQPKLFFKEMDAAPKQINERHDYVRYTLQSHRTNCNLDSDK